MTALARLAPQVPGETDIYAIGVAGWAEQDVFVKELEGALGAIGKVLPVHGPGRLAAAGVDRPGGGWCGCAPATEPPMLAVGSAVDAARTAVGRALGEELAAVGVGWNFAPVLDVHTNREPGDRNRAFGTT